MPIVPLNGRSVYVRNPNSQAGIRKARSAFLNKRWTMPNELFTLPPPELPNVTEEPMDYYKRAVENVQGMNSTFNHTEEQKLKEKLRLVRWLNPYQWITHWVDNKPQESEQEQNATTMKDDNATTEKNDVKAVKDDNATPVKDDSAAPVKDDHAKAAKGDHAKAAKDDNAKAVKDDNAAEGKDAKAAAVEGDNTSPAP